MSSSDLLNSNRLSTPTTSRTRGVSNRRRVKVDPDGYGRETLLPQSNRDVVIAIKHSNLTLFHAQLEAFADLLKREFLGIVLFFLGVRSSSIANTDVSLVAYLRDLDEACRAFNDFNDHVGGCGVIAQSQTTVLEHDSHKE